MNNILPANDYPPIRFYRNRTYITGKNEVYSLKPTGFADCIGYLVSNPHHPLEYRDILYLKTHCDDLGFGSVALTGVRSKKEAKKLLSGLTNNTYNGSDIKAALEASVGNKWDQHHGGEEEGYVPFIYKQSGPYRGYFGRMHADHRDPLAMRNAYKPIGCISSSERRCVEGDGKKKWKTYYKAVVFADWGSLDPILLCDGVSLKEARSCVNKLLKDRKTFVETVATRIAEDIASFRFVPNVNPSYYD